MSTIRCSGETLLILITDILDFSRIEANKMVLSLHHFKLRTVLESAMEIAGLSAAQKRVQVNCRAACRLCAPVDFVEVSLLMSLSGILAKICSFADKEAAPFCLQNVTLKVADWTSENRHPISFVSKHISARLTLKSDVASICIALQSDRSVLGFRIIPDSL